MNKKIVVIGSSNVDLIMKMERLPQVGETVTDATFMQVYGGKGANQAVAAARAGGEVSFVNCVGTDAYTPKMVENFESDGINTQFVFKEPQMVSGHALVMIGSAGRNYLSVAPGANYALTPEYIDSAKSVILEAAILIMQYEIPIETIEHVLNIAEEHDIPVLWNFAPAQKFRLTYCSKVKILVVNETEADFLVKTAVKDLKSAKAAVQELLNLGPNLVILTLGANGVIYGNHDSIQHCPAFKVNALDTTAAGDVFCGSFAVAHVEGKALHQAIEFATAASAICVTQIGAQPSIPYRKDIDAFIKNSNSKARLPQTF